MPTLKERRKDIYDRIVAEWYDWNATMLPEIDESSTDNFTGDAACRPYRHAENERQSG